MLSRVRVLAALATAVSLTFAAKAQSIPGDELVRMPNSSLTGRTESPPMSMAGGAISGSVISSDNKRVRDAKVEIRDLQSGQSVAYGYCDSAGAFSISNLPPGNYEIVVTSGLSQQREQVAIHGMPLQVAVRLPHTGPSPDPSTGSTSAVSVQSLRVPDKAKDALRKAHEAAGKGKLDEARNEIDKALKIEPRYSDAVAFRGVIEMQSGNLSAAGASLNEAIQLDPNNAVAHVAMGSLYNLQNRFEEATREIRRGLTLDPNAWQGHFELSKASLGKGDYDQGLKELEQAQTLLGKRDFSPIHVVKGQLLVGLKAFGAAVSEFQKFLSLDGGSPAASQVRQAMDEAKTFAATAPSPNR